MDGVWWCVWRDTIRKVMIPKKRFLFVYKRRLSRYCFLSERENIKRWLINNPDKRNTTNKAPVTWDQMLSRCCGWTTNKRQMQGRSANSKKRSANSRKKYGLGILILRPKGFLENILEHLHFIQDLQDETELPPIVPLQGGLSLLSVQKSDSRNQNLVRSSFLKYRKRPRINMWVPREKFFSISWRSACVPALVSSWKFLCLCPTVGSLKVMSLLSPDCQPTSRRQKSM